MIDRLCLRFIGVALGAVIILGAALLLASCGDPACYLTDGSTPARCAH